MGRAPNPHIGLGYGMHQCLGGLLAKTEAQVLFEALLRRTRDIAFGARATRVAPPQLHHPRPPLAARRAVVRHPPARQVGEAPPIPRSARGDWIRWDERHPDASLRLICLPHAGGAASAFRGWARDLGPRIEVLPIQYPGARTAPAFRR